MLEKLTSETAVDLANWTVILGVAAYWTCRIIWS